MSLRKRFYLALATSFVVIGAHLVANNLYLYWTYRQIDIPMHIMGGIMSGLYVFWALRYLNKRESVRNVLIWVFIIGILWELLEITYRVDDLNLYYWLDTAKDLIDDLVGAWISVYIWRKLPELPVTLLSETKE